MTLLEETTDLEKQEKTVSVEIPVDVARQAHSQTQFRRNCGEEVDIRDLLLNYVDFDIVYTVEGESIEEWQEKTD